MPGAVDGIPVACRCEALCRGHPREWDPTGSYKPLGPALGRESRRISLVGAATGISVRHASRWPTAPGRWKASSRGSLASHAASHGSQHRVLLAGLLAWVAYHAWTLWEGCTDCTGWGASALMYSRTRGLESAAAGEGGG